MAAPTDVLDAAFDRLASSGFDEANGFVFHGPMICEALDTLGRPLEVDSWSRDTSGTAPTHPVAPVGFVWTDALGEPRRAGEWMGHFERTVDADGWRAVLDEWLPRLLPAMGVALFHGAIRTAHATRAIEVADTPERRAELVRSLGYWAALYEPGERADDEIRGADDPRLAIVTAAADAAHHYVARPNIIHLHGVTAAMAVEILVGHTDDATAARALAQVRAEHAALYGTETPQLQASVKGIDDETLVAAAVASGDAHAVKLVEAALRGVAATGDPIFLAAAERVTRRGLRSLEDTATTDVDA